MPTLPPQPLAAETAVQGQRLGALGRLAGGLAHDFNNLLGIISNNTHLLQTPDGDDEARALIESTLRAVEKGSWLTQQVMRLAHPPPARPRRVDLAQALPEMRQTLCGLAGKRMTITTQVSPGTAPVWVDPDELCLALLNLTLNACDAMPEGGLLQLLADNAHREERSCVQLSVRDDGSGMAPEVAALAFEPFFTTRPRGEGLGLGLAQVQAFCRQAGGLARLQSRPGAGTTVTLLLPAAPAPD